MSEIKPIRPEDVEAGRRGALPSEVIEAFNNCIIKHWNGQSSTFPKNEVAHMIASMIGRNRQYVYDQKYLNVEGIFELEGWDVYYDQPGYCEDYDATYKFSKKRI